MNVYLVLDGSRVVGVSARLQGAEVIRINEAKRLAEVDCPAGPDYESRLQWWVAYFYDRMRWETHQVQDMD